MEMFTPFLSTQMATDAETFSLPEKNSLKILFSNLDLKFYILQLIVCQHMRKIKMINIREKKKL